MRTLHQDGGMTWRALAVGVLNDIAADKMDDDRDNELGGSRIDTPDGKRARIDTPTPSAFLAQLGKAFLMGQNSRGDEQP